MAMTFTGVVSVVLVANGLFTASPIGVGSQLVTGAYVMRNSITPTYVVGSASPSLSILPRGYSPQIGLVHLGSIVVGGKPSIPAAKIGVATQWVAGQFAGGSFVKSGIVDPSSKVSMTQVVYGLVFQTTVIKPPFAVKTMTVRWG